MSVSRQLRTLTSPKPTSYKLVWHWSSFFMQSYSNSFDRSITDIFSFTKTSLNFMFSSIKPTSGYILTSVTNRQVSCAQFPFFPSTFVVSSSSKSNIKQTLQGQELQRRQHCWEWWREPCQSHWLLQAHAEWVCTVNVIQTFYFTSPTRHYNPDGAVCRWIVRTRFRLPKG